MGTPGSDRLESEKLRFPVVCPHCGQESLFNELRLEIAQALSSLSPIHLSSPCCRNGGWVASEVEREQIHQYAELPAFIFLSDENETGQ